MAVALPAHFDPLLMIIAYVRVSTDRQTVENQRYEIQQYALSRSIIIDKWTEETATGGGKMNERKFGLLVKRLKRGDVLIVSELSRIGRNLMQIMSFLHDCMETDIQVFTVKERYELGNNINSKVLAFAFGLAAEIERTLISQRTKEALARKKAEGVILGRPKGRKSDKLKLSGKEEKIQRLLKQKVSVSEIGRRLKVHRLTVSSYIERMNLRDCGQ